MTKFVFKMIALSLQHIEVFVFSFLPLLNQIGPVWIKTTAVLTTRGLPFGKTVVRKKGANRRENAPDF